MLILILRNRKNKDSNVSTGHTEIVYTNKRIRDRKQMIVMSILIVCLKWHNGVYASELGRRNKDSNVSTGHTEIVYTYKGIRDR